MAYGSTFLLFYQHPNGADGNKYYIMYKRIKTSFNTCVFEKYRVFKGTASRAEYWWFWFIYATIVFGLPLFVFIIQDFLSVGESIISQIGAGILMLLWAFSVIGLICPFLAVSVRRLHDAGYSGWHLLWRFIPYIGGIITLILMLSPSKLKNNKYIITA